jgi:PIN domain nuclease of toxin-antitoxin system
LSSAAKDAFMDLSNQLFFSAASFWELSIKISLGKLAMQLEWPQKIQDEIRANGIHWLPIEADHCVRVAKLHFLHRDPFDRMLISQAMVEHMAIMTADDRFRDYGVSIVW